MPATLLHVDSRKRVTLPVEAQVHSGEDLELEVMEDGRLVLTPIVRVPRHQLWLMSPQVERLLQEAAEDDSPLLDLSEPGALAALRADMKKKRSNS
jgi:antitoxin component of MazEF toxin-antitoxin module